MAQSFGMAKLNRREGLIPTPWVGSLVPGFQVILWASEGDDGRQAFRLQWKTGCSVSCCRGQGWPPAAGSTATLGPVPAEKGEVNT